MRDRRPSASGFDHRATFLLFAFLAIALLVHLRVSRGPAAPSSQSVVYPDANRPAPEQPFLSPVRRAFETIAAAEASPSSLDQSIRSLSEFLETQPDSAAAYFGLGWAHQKRGALDDAQEHYWSARLLVRRSATATAIEHFTHHNLASIYAERGMSREAELESTMASLVTSDPVSAGMTSKRSHRARFLYDLAWSSLAGVRTHEQDGAWRESLRAWREGEDETARRGFASLIPVRNR